MHGEKINLLDENNGSRMIVEVEEAFLNTPRAGAIFLKHGQRGNPHYRSVWVKNDLSCIKWGDLKRKKEHGRIYTGNVLEILPGHDTKVFKRAVKYSDPKKCFSLRTSKRTLDLEAISKEQRETWIMAFKFLLEHCKQSKDVEATGHADAEYSNKSMSEEEDCYRRRMENNNDTANILWSSSSGRKDVAKIGTNLVDLISIMDSRLEENESILIKLKKIAERSKEENKKIYMSAMRKSLKGQQVIDSLRRSLHRLTEDNEKLKRQLKTYKAQKLTASLDITTRSISQTQ